MKKLKYITLSILFGITSCPLFAHAFVVNSKGHRSVIHDSPSTHIQADPQEVESQNESDHSPCFKEKFAVKESCDQDSDYYDGERCIKAKLALGSCE